MLVSKLILLHQLSFGLFGIRRTLDELDNVIQVFQGYLQPLQDVSTFLSLLQFEGSSTQHDVTTMLKKMTQYLFQRENLRTVVDDGEHVDAEGDLHVGLLVKVVQDYLGLLTPLQFDDHPHSLPVRLVPDVSNSFNLFLLDQVSYTLQKSSLVDLKREFVYDNAGSVFTNLFRFRPSPHFDEPPACGIGLQNPRSTVDQACCRKIWPGDVVDESNQVYLRVVYRGHQSVDHLG